MATISNYFQFFCGAESPISLSAFLLPADYVYDTRLGKTEEDIDDTCYLMKFKHEDSFFYGLFSQYGRYYSKLMYNNYDLEQMQSDIRNKYINMFNLAKLLQNYGKN